MKAILLWAMYDFPAYGHLSGCRIAGKYGCPVCGEGTNSVRLKYGRKYTYMGHKKFLINMKHPFKSQKSQFNGKEEHGKHPKCLSDSEVLGKIETIQTHFGKVMLKKRKRSARRTRTLHGKKD